MVNPYGHAIRVVGFDLLNRPIIYACFGQASDRFDPETTVKHGTAVLEDAVRYMDEMNKSGINRKHVEQWIAIADFEGFSIKDCSPKLINANRQVGCSFKPLLQLMTSRWPTTTTRSG